MTTAEKGGVPAARAGQALRGERRGSAKSPAGRGATRFRLALFTPAVVFALAICVYPLFSAFRLSFYDYDLTRPSAGPRFVGLDNYVTFLTSTSGELAVRNTLVFAVSSVALELVLGLGLALLLWRDTRLNQTVAALVLIPMAFTPLVAALLFKNLYSTTYGPIGVAVNALAGGSLESIVTDPATAMPALIFVDVWQWTPLIALTLLAALRALPEEVIEAASLDGAGYLRRLVAIVLPQLSRYLFIAAIIRTMDAFKVFDSIYAITGGGPGDATTTLNYLAFTEGLRYFNVGFASAISNILLVIIGVFAAVYVVSLNRLNRKYEGA